MIVEKKKDAARKITAKELRALVKSFPWDEWNKKLAPDLQQVYRDLVVSEGQRAAGARDVDFDQNDPFLQKHMTAYLGERITQLSRTSQKDVIRTLRNALAGDEDLTPAKLQDKIVGAVRKQYEDYETFRALRIARTESAIAYNNGNVLGGMQAGFKRFEVVDGTTDPECAKANGQVWSADKCLQNPIAHPNAVFAGTRISPVGVITRAYRARWSGPAVRFRTRHADMTISPNHPVLTNRGWIPAKQICKGDYVIRNLGLDRNHAATGRATVLGGDLEDRQALVEQVFEALLTIAGHTRVVAAPTYFHGDGNFCQGEVDVVGTDGLLTNESQATLFKELREIAFVLADAELKTLAGQRSANLAFQGVALAPSGGMGSVNVRGVISSATEGDADLSQPIADNAVADVSFLCQLQRRCAGLVTLDQITDVADVHAFVGHAFDLETSSQSYFADGVLVHNCVRAFFGVDED